MLFNACGFTSDYLVKYILVCDNAMLVNTSFLTIYKSISDNEIIAYLINYLNKSKQENFIMGTANFPRQSIDRGRVC